MFISSRRNFLLGAGAQLFTPSIIKASTMDMGNYDPQKITVYNDFKPAEMGYDFFMRPQKGTLQTRLAIIFDKSSSIKQYEYTKQTKGTANALRSSFVKNSILNAHGDDGQRGIGFSLHEFDNKFTTRIPWAILETEDDIENMATIIETMPIHYNRSGTGLSHALNQVVTAMRNAHLRARHSIVDISGDGIENQLTQNEKISAYSVRNASQSCFDNKIKCNGLAINSEDFIPLEFATTITEYYSRFVKTSDGFVIGVNGWEDFQDAMEMKMALEIAQINPDTLHHRFQIA